MNAGWPVVTATRPNTAGFSLLELLFAIGLAATVTAVAIPQVLAGVDAARTRGAARYLATRLQLARSTAVARSVSVGVRFEPNGGGYQFTAYADGNGNGIRTADIQRGIDAAVGGAERLAWGFSGVDVGVLPGLPAIDSSSDPPGSDPVKFGASSIVSFSPIGSCTSGTVYVLGRNRQQYAVRVLGETGRIRVWKFDGGTGKWTPG